jgi:CRP-like cAMP-binding protein
MQQEIARMLKEVPLFSRFSEKQLRVIAKSGQEREFAPGTPIVREGNQINVGFYLILDGQAEVRQGDQVLSKLGAGQFFGEMAILDEQPRSADVVPTTETKCLVFTRWDIKGLIRAYPDMAMSMLEELARRLRNTDQALSV